MNADPEHRVQDHYTTFAERTVWQGPHTETMVAHEKGELGPFQPKEIHGLPEQALAVSAGHVNRSKLGSFGAAETGFDFGCGLTARKS